MANPNRVKTQAAVHPVPQSKDEAVEAIALIGRLQRSRDRIAAAMNDELATIRQQYEAQALPLAERIRATTNGVHLWCEANRVELTGQGKVKFARLASGEVKWRLRPPRVLVRGHEAVLETLRALGLSRFIRVKEEVNKEAVLAETQVAVQVRGLSISQGEDFVITPFETELEEVV